MESTNNNNDLQLLSYIAENLLCLHAPQSINENHISCCISKLKQHGVMHPNDIDVADESIRTRYIYSDQIGLLQGTLENLFADLHPSRRHISALEQLVALLEVRDGSDESITGSARTLTLTWMSQFANDAGWRNAADLFLSAYYYLETFYPKLLPSKESISKKELLFSIKNMILNSDGRLLWLLSSSDSREFNNEPQRVYLNLLKKLSQWIDESPPYLKKDAPFTEIDGSDAATDHAFLFDLKEAEDYEDCDLSDTLKAALSEVQNYVGALAAGFTLKLQSTTHDSKLSIALSLICLYIQNYHLLLQRALYLL